MFFRFLSQRKRLSQSLAEYAILLAIISLALLAMQTYIKRGMQGRLRDLADQIAPVEEHYEDGQTVSSYTSLEQGNTSEIYQDWVSTSSSNQTVETRGSSYTESPWVELEGN